MHFNDLSMGQLRDAGEHLSSCRANKVVFLLELLESTLEE